ncbi:unnamed protein product, partial [Didymodactylos carnosus]
AYSSIVILFQSSPFLVSAYGVNNRYTSIGIIPQLSYIYEECNNKGIRMIGFSTDLIHLATKWRSRILSKTAQMIMGQQAVSLQHLADIIDDDKLSKIDYGLIISNLNPRDLQYFQSCLKITSEDVLQILRDNSDTQATYVYLQLLKYIIVAYVDKSQQHQIKKR